eukprot:482575_1
MLPVNYNKGTRSKSARIQHIPQHHTTYPFKNAMTMRGYTPIEPISNALQGSIWCITNNQTTAMIAKIVNKQLSLEHITYHKNQPIHTLEDITKESAILQYLSANHPPPSLAKYIDFFEDTDHCFLVMEHGGSSLFEFVKQCHTLITQGLLHIDIWHAFCKTAMQQIVSLIDWMHNTMHCCHLDISLENLVIQNVKISMNTGTNKIVKFNHNFQIKIIDFGVAEVFMTRTSAGHIDFNCNKYVGKTGYKAPKIFDKKGMFDARSADIWSLSVCFFMMIIGSPPFKKPSTDDDLFCAMMNGQIIPVLRAWNRTEYVNDKTVDLMSKLFVTQQYRLNIKEIQKHPYLL